MTGCLHLSIRCQTCLFSNRNPTKSSRPSSSFSIYSKSRLAGSDRMPTQCSKISPIWVTSSCDYGSTTHGYHFYLSLFFCIRWGAIDAIQLRLCSPLILNFVVRVSTFGWSLQLAQMYLHSLRQKSMRLDSLNECTKSHFCFSPLLCPLCSLFSGYRRGMPFDLSCGACQRGRRSRAVVFPSPNLLGEVPSPNAWLGVKK